MDDIFVIAKTQKLPKQEFVDQFIKTLSQISGDYLDVCRPQICVD